LKTQSTVGGFAEVEVCHGGHKTPPGKLCVPRGGSFLKYVALRDEVNAKDPWWRKSTDRKKKKRRGKGVYATSKKPNW